MNYKSLILFFSICCFSCGLQTAELSLPAMNNFSVSADSSSSLRVKITKLSDNRYGIFQVEEDRGNLWGVGTGVRNDGRFIFVLNEHHDGWQPLALKLAQQGNPMVQEQLYSLSSIAKNENDLWLTNRNGSVIRGQIGSNQFEVVARLKGDHFKIQFANKLVGYMASRIGLGCKVYKTIDGGNTWEKVYENTRSGNPFDLLVFNEDVLALAMNDEYVLRSENGGISWAFVSLVPSAQDENPQTWVKLDSTGASSFAVNGPKWWVVGERGSLFYSEDLGNSWIRPLGMNALDDSIKFNSIDFSIDGTGLAVSSNGVILGTVDGGEKWKWVTPSSASQPASISEVLPMEDFLAVKFIGDSAILVGRNATYEIFIESSNSRD